MTRFPREPMLNELDLLNPVLFRLTRHLFRYIVKYKGRFFKWLNHNLSCWSGCSTTERTTNSRVRAKKMVQSLKAPPALTSMTSDCCSLNDLATWRFTKKQKEIDVLPLKKKSSKGQANKWRVRRCLAAGEKWGQAGRRRGRGGEN